MSCEEVSDSIDSPEKNLTSKPTIDQFLESFEDKIKQVNQTYQSSKQQFEQDMKMFKEADIEKEEEQIY